MIGVADDDQLIGRAGSRELRIGVKEEAGGRQDAYAHVHLARRGGERSQRIAQADDKRRLGHVERQRRVGQRDEHHLLSGQARELDVVGDALVRHLIDERIELECSIGGRVCEVVFESEYDRVDRCVGHELDADRRVEVEPRRAQRRRRHHVHAHVCVECANRSACLDREQKRGLRQSGEWRGCGQINEALLFILFVV